MKNFHLKDYVKHYPDFLEPSFCKKLVKKLQKINWIKHSYYDHISGQATSYDNDLHINLEPLSEDKIIREKLKFAIDEYMRFLGFEWFYSLTNYSEVRWNRYDVNTEMRLHCDHIQSLFTGENRGVPILTMLGGLNNNYEGGELTMFDRQIIPLKEGELVIFPSTFMYPHSVLPVKKGIRYSFVSWGW